MTKEEIQKRLLKDGKPLSMDLFAWDESTKTFSTNEDDVVIDFSGINSCTIRCRNYCTIDCADYCTIICFTCCIIKCGDCCVIKCSNSCRIECADYCTIKCSNSCRIECADYCVCVRRDIFEFFEIPVGEEIKLNSWNEKGYSFLDEKHIITIDGKNIELSKESYDNLKKQLLGE